MVTDPERLDSWKEIAAYLNRSVRTVRRWETSEGLPVHRHMHRNLGSVYALKSEIDAWRSAAHERTSSPEPEHDVATIAVLPFTNLSPEREDEYLAGGLTEEVIADLSKIAALRVTSRTSSMALKDTKQSMRVIGRELGVRYVVEGSVRRAGSDLRIAVRLIDATTDYHLWSERYDGAFAEVFSMQERLARTIVDALRLRLSPDEDRRLSSRPVHDVYAYECYLQARQESLRWNAEAIDHAIQLLEKALGVEGDNPHLHAALGRVWLQYREAGIDLGQRPLAEAVRCSARASALDPDAVSGVLLRGWIAYSNGDVQQAVHNLKSALEREPNNADALGLLANCYLISGYTGAARPLIERLLAVDPLTPLTRCMPGWADILEGRFESALDPYRTMFEMDSANPLARLFYVWVLTLNGRPDEAVAVARTAPARTGETIPARLALFLAQAAAGARKEALEALSPEVEGVANTTDLFPRFLAHGFALAAERERALHWLTIAVERGFINYPFLSRHDPFLAGLRDDPRFGLLLDDVKRRWQRFET